MTTTALAVELVIIGYQTLIWLVLAASLLFPCDVCWLTMLKDWKEPILVGSIAIAYTLGATVNTISSRVLQPFEGKCVFKEEKPSVMRAAILVRQPEALKQVMTYFDAPRVLRSTILNTLLIGVFTTIRFWCLLSWCKVLTLIVCFFLLASLAAWAWYEADDNYYTHLCATYDALNATKT
jgi:hypothetical protein